MVQSCGPRLELQLSKLYKLHEDTLSRLMLRKKIAVIIVYSKTAADSITTLDSILTLLLSIKLFTKVIE